jgi:hypothetical protein
MEDRVSERTCTIEFQELAPVQTITGAFIQLGALQQASSSFRDRNKDRFGQDDEYYLLLVNIDALSFEELAAKPQANEVIHKLMKDFGIRKTYLSDKTAYVDSVCRWSNRLYPASNTQGSRT